MNNFNFLGNDTIAISGLVIIAIVGLIVGIDNVTSVAVGAIGGYIGGKTLDE